MACCPEDADGAPNCDATQSRQRRLQQSNPSFDPSALYPNGCSSGSVTGTRADRARCHIVEINLEGNGLVSSQLPEGIFNLPYLETLNLANNSISGQLPVPDLRAGMSMDLRSNSMDYPPPRGIRQACLEARNQCPGYPPISCLAFGENFVVAADEASSCVECGHRWVTVVVLVVMSILFFIGLGLYISCIFSRRGEVVKDGISTVSIFITRTPETIESPALSLTRGSPLPLSEARSRSLTQLQLPSSATVVADLQTIDIVSHLRLAWPTSTEAGLLHIATSAFALLAVHTISLSHPVTRSTRSITAAFRFTFVNGLTFESARPECLTDGNEQFSFYYAASLTKVSLPIVLLLSCMLARCVLRYAFWRQWLRRSTTRQHEMIDKLHVYESVVFQFQLCSSWRNAYNLLRTFGQASNATAGHIGTLALWGGYLAVSLFTLQVGLLIKYFLSTYSMVVARRTQDKFEHGAADDGSAAPSPATESRASAVSSGRLRATRRILGHGELDVDRLEQRTSYIGKRFGGHGAFARRPFATPRQLHHP